MNIFKDKSTTDDVHQADDPQWSIAVAQVPSDDSTVVVPNQHRKTKWPASVVSAQRPRYGHNY